METKRTRGRPRTTGELHKRSVSFPPNLYKRLEERAAHEERNVNELIVAVLREFMREDKSPGNSKAVSTLA